MTDTVVVIVNYESGAGLRRCLASVLGQVPPPARLLVVDNASRDGSADGLPEGVDLIRRSENGGYAAALLDGLAGSHEPFILTLNPDTVLEAGALATSVEALEGDHAAGSVALRVIQENHPELLDATGIGLTSFLGQINWDHGLPDVDTSLVAQEVLGPLGGAALWRRIALERAGNFDPRFFLYWEDMDIALRLNRAGYECRTVPAARVLHEGGGSVGHHSPRNVFYMVRNHWPCLIQSLPGPTLRANLGALLLAPLRAAALYARRGRGLSALAGLICGMALIPRSLLARRYLIRSGGGQKAAERLALLMDSADANRLAMRKMRAVRSGTSS